MQEQKGNLAFTCITLWYCKQKMGNLPQKKLNYYTSSQWNGSVSRFTGIDTSAQRTNKTV